MTTSTPIRIAPSVPPAEGELTVTSSGVAGLALPFLVATQTAALACLPCIGRGDPKAADGAAVAALRDALAGPEPGPGGWWTTSLLSTSEHPALIVKAFVPRSPA